MSRKLLQTAIILLSAAFFVSTAGGSAPETNAGKRPATATIGDHEIALIKKLHIHLVYPPRPAAQFSLPDLDNKVVSLASLKGNYVLLTFWAEWCSPCIFDLFVRSQLQRHLKGLPVKMVDVVLLSPKIKPNSRLSMIATLGLDSTVLTGPEETLRLYGEKFGINAIPAFILIDPEGNVFAKYMGAKIDWESPEILELVKSFSRRLSVPPTDPRIAPSPGRNQWDKVEAEADRLFQEGWKRDRAGEEKSAWDSWRLALQKYRSAGAFKKEGWSLYALGKKTPAYFRREYFGKALRSARASGDAHLEGLVLLAQGAEKAGDKKNHPLDSDLPALKSLLERAVAILRRYGDNKNMAVGLRHLGIVNSRLGEFRSASKNLFAAYEIFEKSKDAFQIAATISDLGEYFDDIGNYKTAIEVKRIAFNAWKKSGEEEEMARALAALASSYALANRPRSAIKVYERSIGMLREKGMKKEADQAAGEQAFEYVRVRDWPKVRDLYKHMDPVRKAAAFLWAGQYEKAAAILQNSGKRSPGWREDKDFRFGRNMTLGFSHEFLGNRAVARKHYEEAVRIVEEDRDRLSGRIPTRFFAAAPFIYKRSTAYEGLIRVSEPEEAFANAEALKARLLLEQTARLAAEHLPALPESLRRKEAENVRKLSLGLQEKESVAAEIAQREAGARLPGETVMQGRRKLAQLRKQRQENEKNIEGALRERSELIARMYQEAPEYASIRYPRPLLAGSVFLHPGEVLIEYAVTGLRLKAFLLRDRKIVHSVERKVSSAALSRMAMAFRRQITTLESLSRPIFDMENGHKLFELLLGEFVPLIKPGETIVIVPDGSLSFLPFEALPMRPGRPEVKEGKYGYYPLDVEWLGDKFPIRYSYSASTLSQKRLFKREVPKDSVFVLADPIFGPDDPRVRTEKTPEPPANRSVLMKAIEGELGIELPRLKETEQLAASLKSTFGDSVASMMLGPAATKRNLVRQNLKGYRYIVFATHGLLGGQVKGLNEPALALTGAGTGDKGAFLTLSDVMRLRLNADVVALTACETGLGESIAGEGVMGMGRAFQYAGARSVLVSLWSVAEVSTTLLVEKFFSRLKRGEEKIAALRNAQKDVRESGFRHPFFWAPFILIGE